LSWRNGGEWQRLLSLLVSFVVPFLNARRILHSWLDEYDDTPFAFCIEEERDLDRPKRDNE
jgi:hypothetical protein